MTTWGIFWISLFSAFVLISFMQRVLPSRGFKMDDETYDKVKELIQFFVSCKGGKTKKKEGEKKD